MAALEPIGQPNFFITAPIEQQIIKSGDQIIRNMTLKIMTKLEDKRANAQLVLMGLKKEFQVNVQMNERTKAIYDRMISVTNKAIQTTDIPQVATLKQFDKICNAIFEFSLIKSAIEFYAIDPSETIGAEEENATNTRKQLEETLQYVKLTKN